MLLSHTTSEEQQQLEENEKVIQDWEQQYEIDNLSLSARTDLPEAQKGSLLKGPAQPIRKNPVDESSFDESANFARECIRKEVIKAIVTHPLAKFVPMLTKQCVEVLKQILPKDIIALWYNHCATQPSRGHHNMHAGCGSYKGSDMSKCCSVIAMKAISEFFRTITSFTCGDDVGDLQLANIREFCLTIGDAFQHCAPGTQMEADALVAITQLYLDGISKLGGYCLVASTAGSSSNMDQLVLSRLVSPSPQIKIASRSTRHIQFTRTPSPYLDADESARRTTKEFVDLSDEVIQPFLDIIGYNGESFKDFTLRHPKLPFITNSPEMLNLEYDQKWQARKDERIESLLHACWRALAHNENALVGDAVVAEGETSVILTYVTNHVDEMYTFLRDRGDDPPSDPKDFSIRHVLGNMGSNGGRKTQELMKQRKECAECKASGGVCDAHGAVGKKKECSAEGCTKHVVNNGVCAKHGAEKKKRKKRECSAEGCTKHVQNNGVCIKHGAEKKKKCSVEGCTKQVQKNGVCIKHGAHTSK